MLLFLDFDGVLRPLHGEKAVFPCLPRLEQVLREHPDIDIVISSSWREEHDLHALRNHFSSDIGARIIGSTPVFEYLDHVHVRQAEITEWLQGHKREAELWIALDDDDWLFEPAHPNLVLVDPEFGFDEKAEKAFRKALSEKP